jgi:hypothetical protein
VDASLATNFVLATPTGARSPPDRDDRARGNPARRAEIGRIRPGRRK